MPKCENCQTQGITGLSSAELKPFMNSICRFAIAIFLIVAMTASPYVMAQVKRKKDNHKDVLSTMLNSLRGGVSEPTVTDAQLRLKQFSLKSDGFERTFYVHLPPNYNGKQAMPLVLVFHGATGRARLMPKLTGMNTFADAHSFIAVYPEGLNTRWNEGNGGKTAAELNDVHFAAAMLDKLNSQYKIDKKRIYATGISNGGFFAQYLAINMPNTFAAVAVVAATLEESTYKNFKPSKPLPILFICGDDDAIVPYNGGSVDTSDEVEYRTIGRAVSAQDAVKYWVKANICFDKAVIANLPDAKPNDGTHVIRRIYSGGKDGSEVVFFTIKNGGHTWPSGWQYLPDTLIGLTSKAINADAEIWSFFQRHHL
jgi:polyhydroxybutyrate depolymerase